MFPNQINTFGYPKFITMAKVILEEKHLSNLATLEASVSNLNNQRIKTIFKALHITVDAKEFEIMLGWKSILIVVPDRQMAVQLNKLSAYIPNLMFVVDTEREIFKVVRGEKVRRVWKH